MNKELITEVADGIIGALDVACRLYRMSGDEILNRCVEQGLTGSTLWIAYKDLCRESIELLVWEILAADPIFVAKAKAGRTG